MKLRTLASSGPTRCVVAVLLASVFACAGEAGRPASEPTEPMEPRGTMPPPATGTGGSGPASMMPVPPVTAAAAPLARRLTREELLFTLEDSLGIKLGNPPFLPREGQSDGLSNDAIGLVVSAEHAQGYLELGPAVVQAIGDVRTFVMQLAGCAGTDEACELAFVNALGGRLFRRPLTADESNELRAIFAAARAGGLDFVAGAAGVLEAMLQAPQFLYRLENEKTGRPGTRQVSGHELASRLSYFLWGSAPDADLERAARSGVLDTPVGLATQVDRMIALQPRAQRASGRFVRDWLWLDKLDGITRGDLPATFARELLDSAVATIQDTIWTPQKSIAALFDGRTALLTPAVASWMGLKGNGTAGTLARYDLGAASERAGLLTHPGVITVMSDSDNGGIVARGLYILERVLCRHSVPPPAGLDTSAFTTHLGKEATERQYSEDRLKTASCGACHQQFDPLAYPFERFDGVGRFRTKNAYDIPLRADGQVQLDGATRAYKNAVDFSVLIAGSDQLSKCVAERSLQSALGRLLEPTEEPLVLEVQRAFQASGGTFSALFATIAKHPAFRTLRTE